jgi:hypothetical protein
MDHEQNSRKSCVAFLLFVAQPRLAHRAMIMTRDVVGKKWSSSFCPYIFLPQESSVLKRCFHCTQLRMPELSLRSGRCSNTFSAATNRICALHTVAFRPPVAATLLRVYRHVFSSFLEVPSPPGKGEKVAGGRMGVTRRAKIDDRTKTLWAKKCGGKKMVFIFLPLHFSAPRVLGSETLFSLHNCGFLSLAVRLHPFVLDAKTER